MRGKLVLGLLLVCAALAACAATAPAPDGMQDTGSSAPMHGDGDDPSTVERDAGRSTTDAEPDTVGEAAGPDCAVPHGVFEPLYTPLSGTCGPLDDANYVPMEDDTQIQKFANVDVETETIVMGCSVALVQIVRDKAGVPQKRITGTLQFEPPSTLSGEVTLARFDQNGVAVCTGTYDATLTRNTTTLGGAAQGR